MGKVSFTLVHVNFINPTAGWQAPDILRDGDFRYFDNALTALQFAEYRCGQYNNKHPNHKKIPIVNSELHSKKMAKVYVGEKARDRLLIPKSKTVMPIRNVFVLESPDNELLGKRAFGQIISNGEIQSVVSKDNIRGSIVPDDMQWKNFSVQELKRRYGYPSNPFFPSTNRPVDGVYLPTPARPVASASRFADGGGVIKFTLYDTAINPSELIKETPTLLEKDWHTVTGRLPTEFVERFGTGYAYHRPSERAVDFSQLSFGRYESWTPFSISSVTLDAEGDIAQTEYESGETTDQ